MSRSRVEEGDSAVRCGVVQGGRLCRYPHPCSERPPVPWARRTQGLGCRALMSNGGCLVCERAAGNRGLPVLRCAVRRRHFVLSWFEQKAVAVLLTLLHLG
jgi:hypothetical protein